MTKKVTSKKSVNSKMVEESPFESMATPVKTKSPNKFPFLLAVVILIGVGGFLLAKKYKGLVVAGVVNTQPITRMQFEKVLVGRYGQQAFDEMANNILLEQLAAKNGVKTDSKEVANEIKKYEDQVGGKDALNSMLQKQGMTRADLEEQARITVLANKLAQKLFKVTVEDSEVKKYYDDNKSMFDKKTFDEVKDQIKSYLEQQKVGEKFSEWFQGERLKATIKSYI